MRTAAVTAACAALLVSCSSPDAGLQAGTSPLPAAPVPTLPSLSPPTSAAATSPARPTPARPSPASATTPPARASASPAPGAPTRDPARRYEFTGTVLQSPDHGPRLCAGAMRTSYPPQCGDVPVTPFSWEQVEGEESYAGTTWGEVRLVGTFDGTAFHPTEPPRAPRQERRTGDDWDPMPLPCPAPPGGWRVVDDSKVSQEDQDAVMAYANGHRDVAGVWLSWLRRPTESTPQTEAVLVLAFTGDLDRHRREARERWGGPLCVTELPRSRAELERVQRAFSDEIEEAAAAGVHLYTSGINESENVIEAGVLIADAVSRHWVDQRFGRGWVRLSGTLRPVA